MTRLLAAKLMPETEKQDEPGSKSWIVTLARYSQLAFVLPAATVTGWILGLLLDHWLHTTWLYLAGLIVGIIAGFVELFRTVIRSGDGK